MTTTAPAEETATAPAATPADGTLVPEPEPEQLTLHHTHIFTEAALEQQTIQALIAFLTTHLGAHVRGTVLQDAPITADAATPEAISAALDAATKATKATKPATKKSKRTKKSESGPSA